MSQQKDLRLWRDSQGRPFPPTNWHELGRNQTQNIDTFRKRRSGEEHALCKPRSSLAVTIPVSLHTGRGSLRALSSAHYGMPRAVGCILQPLVFRRISPSRALASSPLRSCWIVKTQPSFGRRQKDGHDPAIPSGCRFWGIGCPIG